MNGKLRHARTAPTRRRRPTTAISGCASRSLVHGDELIRHIVEGETVLEYTKPQIGGGNVSPVDPKVKVDGTPLTGGYISIQAETAPTDFRKIELLNLEGLHGPEGVELQDATSSRPTRRPAR